MLGACEGSCGSSWCPTESVLVLPRCPPPLDEPVASAGGVLDERSERVLLLEAKERKIELTRTLWRCTGNLKAVREEEKPDETEPKAEPGERAL